jgi:hypothetical protein
MLIGSGDSFAHGRNFLILGMSLKDIRVPIKSFFVSICFAFVFSAPATAQNTARIAGFQAHLFNSKTGELSDDMLAKGAHEMGNVPAGDFASISTFIVVKVDLGKEAPIPLNAQVRLVATESDSMPFAAKPKKERNRIILDRTSRLGPVNTDGNTYVGFWLASTGCKSISLKAFLLGLKDKPSLTGVLPFACYE